MKKLSKLQAISAFLVSLILFSGIVFTIYYKYNGSVLGEVEDNQAPQLVAFEITKGTFNTEEGTDTVSISATITDNLVGFSHGFIRWVPANPDRKQFFPSQLEFVSGDELNGTYTSTREFPRYSPSGAWRIEGIELYDEIMNYVYITEEELEELFDASSGFFRANNTATVEDIIAPQIVSLSITSGSTIDTSSASQDVIISLVVQDNLVGSKPINDLGIFARMNPIDVADIGQETDVMWEITAQDGLQITYTGTCTIPRGAKNGYWIINDIALRDNIDNVESNINESLCQRFGNSACRVNNVATSFDVDAPVIKSFSISPTQFDTSVGDVEITMEIEYEDLVSGVDVGDIGGTITPLIGTQFRPFSNFEFVEGSGDDFSGKHRGKVTLPQYSKTGIWQVNLGGIDKLGNRIDCEGSRWSPSCDAFQLFPDSKSVLLINTSVSNSVTIDRDWTISTPDISATFPQGTTVLKKEGGAFAFYRMITKAYSTEDYGNLTELIEQLNAIPEELENPEEIEIDIFETVIACEAEENCVDTEVTAEQLLGTPVGTVRVGIPGLNLEFSEDVTISVAVDPKYNGWTLHIQTFEEGGEVWALEDTCIVADGRCVFTVDHASYFSANAIADTQNPKGSVKINGDTYVSNSKSVKLDILGTDDSSGVRYMRISNNGVKWTKWIKYSTKYKGWNMTDKNYGGNSSEGDKAVYIQFKDGAKRVSKIYADKIIYNPRKVALFRLSKHKVKGASKIEYVVLKSNLKGKMTLATWSFKNAAGTSINLPKVKVSAGGTLAIYSKKGTNKSNVVFLGQGSSSNFWNDGGDTMKIYSDSNVRTTIQSIKLKKL